ncbi:MAG TPA: 2-oxoglutarate and iron-dependent oxygenase domain-containing protein [Stellaceae bacterium]|nr:2-oxoglutarate and iron-dependent oxygenase domain-containing protein [Stellaceae bacterium]
MTTQLPASIPFVTWPSGDGPWAADETRRAATAVGDACRHSGYFFLRNHGVPAELIAAAFDETSRFYSRPPDQKAKFTCSAQSQFLGYRGLGAEKSRMHSGAEACEQYRIGNYVATPALSGLAGLYHEPFRQGMLLFEEMVKVGGRLMSLCALDLGLDNRFFDRFMQAPMHRLGLNYYKVGAGRAIGNSVNIAMTAHVDHAVFTILTHDGPGLEVLSAEDEWLDVPIPPDALFVFLGDYAQRWTNGAYRAATHRVREVSSDRMSLQYKHKPSYATVVTPLSPFVDEGHPARYESFDTGRQYEVLLQALLAK